MPHSATIPKLPHLLQGIEGDLERVEAWLEEQTRSEDPHLAPLLVHVRRFRGKRLRAAQVLLVGRACGNLVPDHYKVAGIIEMIHAATLVHDDILDQAGRRRGVASVHVTWGVNPAVLLGDWFYARAFLRSTELEDQTCSRILAGATGRICAAEIHQNLTCGDFDLSERDYLAQIDGKTASLYEAAGLLGAYYAGAGPEEERACARHGLLAGRAFQVADDLLDLVGEEEHVGKSLGTDWARSKMTLPLIRLRESLAPPLQEKLRERFGTATHQVVLLDGDFRKAFEAAMESCRDEVEKILFEAREALSVLPDHPARRALAELTGYLGTRQK